MFSIGIFTKCFQGYDNITILLTLIFRMHEAN